MSNPFVPPSLTGYNANPPANDGTADAANQLDWDNHITKIGDPLRTYMLAQSTAISTAFDVAFGNSVITITSPYTMTSADRGRLLRYIASADGTLTMIDAADPGVGFVVGIVNSGTAKLTVSSSDTINGAASIELFPNESAILASDGSVWAGIVSRDRLTVAVKAASEERTNSTLPTGDSELFVSLVAGATYEVDALFRLNSTSSTPGFSYTFGVGVGGTTTGGFQAHGIDEGLVEREIFAGLWGATPSIAITADDDVYVTIKGSIQRSVAATFGVSWAQNVSNATATNMLAGSYLRLTRMS